MKAKWIGIVIAIVIIVGAGAGYGGYTMGVQAGQTRAAQIRTDFLAARQAGGQQGGANPGQGARGGLSGMPAGGQAGQSGGAQFNSANFAIGQVKQIDGNTVQLSTATEVLKVTISDQTQIQKTGQGSLGDIQPGERITVQGTKASDGSFSAQMIQIGGSGGGPGGAAPPAAPGTPTTKN